MNDDRVLWVNATSKRYPIVLTDNFLSNELDWRAYIGGKQVLIVSNPTIAELFLDKLTALLTDYTTAICLLPDGESHKTQASIDKIYDVLMQNRFSRDCTIIALGGGVIGDMAGFAAASFMRGVDFIQIPTTLLSQVDSSVGGKTGINHPLGKNMIGAFWQPVCVLADMGVLGSLPVREFGAGLAEVIKYALIMDKDFLAWLNDNRQAILDKNPNVLATMVKRSCAYKAHIVAIDEKEQNERAWLNFGHTFGHAIEAYMGYGSWLHGEAVAVGMVQGALLSYGLGLIGCDDVLMIVDSLKAFGLPVVPPKADTDELLALMSRDKKAKSGQLRFIVLNAIGQADIRCDVPVNLVRAVLTADYEKLANGKIELLAMGGERG